MDNECNSGAPDMDARPSVVSKHVRAYQACDPCRKKKQRCDMGPVDNRHAPPCAACLREGKACTFSSTRNKASSLSIPRSTAASVERATSPPNECIEEHAKQVSNAGYLEPDKCIHLLGTLKENDCEELFRSKLRPEDYNYGLVVITVKRAWSEFAPIRQGLFSIQEAVALVEFFYEALWPLTPTPVGDYRHMSKHPALLKEEPLLAVAILTISSRHATMDARGTSRAVLIHDRLSQCLRHYIEKIPSGEATTKRETTTNAKFHTIGTIEALMLLVDWHTRSIDLPVTLESEEFPSASGDEDEEQQSESKERSQARMFQGYKTPKEKRAHFLKSCYRSDHQCKMYMSKALFLAHQLGLFNRDPLYPRSYEVLPDETVEATRRRSRVRYLLFVHAAFMAGKLSIPSAYPEEHTTLQFDREVVDAAHGHAQFSLSESEAGRSELERDVAIYFYYRLAYDIVLPANKELYSSSEQGVHLIKSGAYKKKIHEHLIELDDFKFLFDQCKHIPKLLRYNLTIDYEYYRAFVANLGLQAVIARFHGHNILNVETRRAILPYAIGDDRKYIVEVGNSGRNALRFAVHKLQKYDSLKFATSRVFTRIIRVSTILLQAFIFSSTETECEQTIKIFHQAIEKLGSYEIDDTHIAGPISETLDGLVKDLEKFLLRITPSLASDSAVDGLSVTAPARRLHRRSISQSVLRSKRSSGSTSRFNDVQNLPNHFSALSTSPSKTQLFGSVTTQMPQPEPTDPANLGAPAVLASNDAIPSSSSLDTPLHSEDFSLLNGAGADADLDFSAFATGDENGSDIGGLSSMQFTDDLEQAFFFSFPDLVARLPMT